MRNLPKQSLTELVDTRDVSMLTTGKYSTLYEVLYQDCWYWEVISNTTFEVIYRSDSYFFACRRFQENNQD